MIRLLLLLTLALSLNATEYIKTYVNKNHALITFVESLSGSSYLSPIPKQVYLENFTRKSIRDLLRDHKMIVRSRIYNHKKTKSLLEALYFESLKYKTFDEFKKGILKFKTSVGKKRLSIYMDKIDEISYIYEKFIWDKYHKKLKYKKHLIDKIIKKSKYDQLILTLAKFYHVEKKDIDEMIVALYPIPRTSNIRAYSIKNIETVGIYPKERKNLKWLLSATVLHEISHTLYAKSSFIKSSFSKIKDKQKRRLLNEVFATAIGAGWGYKKLTDKSSKRYQWYNNKEYDRLAKILYPKIKDYLNSNKGVDKKLIDFIKKEAL